MKRVLEKSTPAGRTEKDGGGTRSLVVTAIALFVAALALLFFDAGVIGRSPALFTLLGLGIYAALVYIILQLLQSRAMLKRKARELERSRAWLDTLLSSSVDGIHILDVEGKLVACSPSFLEMLGYGEEDAARLTVYDWETRFSPPEIQNVLETITLSPISFETVCRRKEGCLIDVEMTARAIFDNGRKYIYASARETTDIRCAQIRLRESEEFYRTVFASVNEAIVILHANTIYDCNESTQGLFEKPREALVGMDIFKVFHEIDCREHTFHDYLDSAYRGEYAAAECSLRLHPDGDEEKIIEFTLSGYGRENENKIIMIARDITRQAEEDKILRMHMRQAQMGEMISMIAHQWRQPLAIINAIASQMRLRAMIEEKEDPAAVANLVKIEEQSAYLSQTISDYRDFFRPDKPKERFSVASLLGNALGLIDHTLKNHAIEAEVVVQEDALLYTYRNELLQVLIALLKNALDAFIQNSVANGKITVTIGRGGKYCLIAIRDNAGGIPEAARKKIFLPYFTTKHNSHGTGLGLYMSRIIIHEHCEGAIEVHSEGAETTFTLKIPYEKEAG